MSQLFPTEEMVAKCNRGECDHDQGGGHRGLRPSRRRSSATTRPSTLGVMMKTFRFRNNFYDDFKGYQFYVFPKIYETTGGHHWSITLQPWELEAIDDVRDRTQTNDLKSVQAFVNIVHRLALDRVNRENIALVDGASKEEAFELAKKKPEQQKAETENDTGRRLDDVIVQEQKEIEALQEVVKPGLRPRRPSFQTAESRTWVEHYTGLSPHEDVNTHKFDDGSQCIPIFGYEKIYFDFTHDSKIIEHDRRDGTSDFVISWEKNPRLAKSIEHRPYHYGINMSTVPFVTKIAPAIGHLDEQMLEETLRVMGHLWHKFRETITRPVVMGCQTDGIYFEFLKIDGEAMVRRSNRYNIFKDMDRIFAHLVQSFRVLSGGRATEANAARRRSEVRAPK